MSNRPPREPGASVFTDLRRLRSPQRDFNRVLQQFTVERFLYRLSQSSVSDRFTLKGATPFVVWVGETCRGMQDVDPARWRSPVRRRSAPRRQAHHRFGQATRRLLQAFEPDL